MSLILSLLVDPESQQRFDALRTAHFPPDRLVVGAHVTLFHALPEELCVLDEVRRACAAPPFDVEVTGLRSLGRGVALVLTSPGALALRGQLASCWTGSLTPQDAQPWSPHVTVQNKVDPTVARRLLTELAGSFQPWTCRARGVGVWRYVGGPWKLLAEVPLSG